MKFKKFVLCILLFFMCVTMFGCANVNLSTRITSDGVIETKLNIKIENTGDENDHAVFNIITDYFKQLENQYIISLVEKYEKVYEEELKVYKDTQSKFNYIYQKEIDKFLISKGESIFDECVPDYKNKTLTITKQFGSIYAYLMYFYPDAFDYDEKNNQVVISNSYKSMIDVPMGGEFEKEESLFITKYVQSCKPFYYNGQEPRFFESTTTGITEGDSLVELLEDRTGLTRDQVKLMFDFSTPYKRIHSDGSVSITNKGYTHSWQLNNLGDKITIWRTYANYIPWYIVAGALGILIFVVGAIIIVIINKHKKRQGLKALNKINIFMNDNEKK